MGNCVSEKSKSKHQSAKKSIESKNNTKFNQKSNTVLQKTPTKIGHKNTINSSNDTNDTTKYKSPSQEIQPNRHKTPQKAPGNQDPHNPGNQSNIPFPSIITGVPSVINRMSPQKKRHNPYPNLDSPTKQLGELPSTIDVPTASYLDLGGNMNISAPQNWQNQYEASYKKNIKA